MNKRVNARGHPWPLVWATVAKGFVVVPREPTERMRKAAVRYLRANSEINIWAAWHAMIDAALEEQHDE